MDLTEHRMDSDGLELFVVEAGPTDGAAVVLVHGWPDTHQSWNRQIAPLADAGYRVLALDQRGFGRSARPTNRAGYHVFNAMADLSNLLDSLEIDSAHIVGHDWGAPPGWLLATFAPERVRTLTAISVGHPTAFRNAGIEQRRRSFYMLLFQFEDIAERWLSDDDWSNLRELLGPTNEIERIVEGLSASGALTSSLEWYRSNMAPETLVDEAGELPPVTRPVLGIMGGEDWALTLEQMTASADYVDADFRVEVVDEAAHWVQSDTPERLNSLLLQWFATHESDQKGPTP